MFYPEERLLNRKLICHLEACLLCISASSFSRLCQGIRAAFLASDTLFVNTSRQVEKDLPNEELFKFA